MVRPPPAPQLHEAEEEVIPRAEREDPEVNDLGFRPAECAGQPPRGLEDRNRERETNEKKAAAAITSDFQDEPKNELYLIEF